jgi:vacuolar-type H+-ATPase subunit E/Vma4
VTWLAPEAEQALAPVRTWLLDAARADADALLAQAAAEAEARLARAQAEAAALVETARAEGEALGTEAAARELTRARREARARLLRAQADLLDRLREQARAAVLALRADAGYPALVEQLTARARAVLGPDAAVTEADLGGVVGQAGSRRVDLSLPALAEWAIADLGAEVTRLWS